MTTHTIPNRKCVECAMHEDSSTRRKLSVVPANQLWSLDHMRRDAIRNSVRIRFPEPVLFSPFWLALQLRKWKRKKKLLSVQQVTKSESESCLEARPNNKTVRDK